MVCFEMNMKYYGKYQSCSTVACDEVSQCNQVIYLCSADTCRSAASVMEDIWTWPKTSRPNTCRCRSSRTPSSTQISSHHPTSLLTSKTSTRSKVHTQPAVCWPSDQLQLQASQSSVLLWFYHIQSVFLEQHLQQPPRKH